ncbi:EAL domain-containing protein [Shewanella sp. AS16]|uniref:bifunctional diguanylate cyclase/phosphodiesterase n=1 Tax=Shewanella sp. AS16 TaxID=2907625 RepID=UPI001F3EA68F|nr:EAL domain-containing protein [Shewanella sp. AS16]MCE9685982.1 EAL domain-containing protein [Shewanella sp. AS16]
MTLFREIYSLLFTLFLLIVASLGYVQFTETQDFLTKQMESDLNNASNSLGLMLVPALETGDTAAAETLVNVIFEGGYYQNIKLTWLVDGKQQEWHNSIRIEDTPQWFLDLHLFDTIKKESTITSGWLQLAKLEITAHPGFGYHELWRIISNTLIAFSLLFLVAILFARIGLGWILKPLHTISDHARDVARRQFSPDMPLPRTSELKEVVQAFNSMSAQLKQVFDSLDDEIATLRKKTLVDQVSGLPNRQYMVSRLNGWLNEPSNGALFLARLDCLEEIHNRYGYQIRDETIRLMSIQFKAQLDDIAPSLIARISAVEFAFLVTNVEYEKLNKYLETLIRTINQEITKADCKPNEHYAIGIAERIELTTVTDIMAQADNALQNALQNNKVYQWHSIHEQQIFTREQWRAKLNSAINDKQFQFRWQPVLRTDTGAISQRELYCQLQLGDKLVHAGQFMPYVDLLSLGSQLDKCLIQALGEHDVFAHNPEPVAINLTLESIISPQFHAWLDEFLRTSAHTKHICFEIPELGVFSDADACQTLCDIIRKHGAKFGIDHFGRQFGSMSYLQKLRPNYVKLDQSFAYYDEHQQNSELCRALINVAKGLDIEVIVTGIQEKIQLERFAELRIDAYQGYIAPPIQLELDAAEDMYANTVNNG